MEILGDQWEPEVWDNIGWHCAWRRGGVNLHYSVTGNYYHVLIGTPGGYGGHMDLSPAESLSDPCPKVAIRKACVYAQKIFQEEWDLIKLSVADVMLGLAGLPEMSHYNYTTLEEAATVIASYPRDESVVVFTRFPSQGMTDIFELVAAKGVTATMLSSSDRDEILRILDDFRAGRIKMLFLSLQVFYTGVNLVNADRMVLLDQAPDGAMVDQAVGRAHRIGRSTQLQVTRLNRSRL